jgi:hypothetical protein
MIGDIYQAGVSRAGIAVALVVACTEVLLGLRDVYWACVFMPGGSMERRWWRLLALQRLGWIDAHWRGYWKEVVQVIRAKSGLITVKEQLQGREWAV